jgi:hypothetical protein
MGEKVVEDMLEDELVDIGDDPLFQEKMEMEVLDKKIEERTMQLSGRERKYQKMRQIERW